MDYVTRQFIVLINKFREEFRKYQSVLHRDVSQLSDNLKDLKNAVHAQREANKEAQQIEPTISISNFRTDVAIPIENKTQKTEKKRGWKIFKRGLETAVGVAVIVYTGVTFENWQEQIDATNLSAKQTEYARKGLNETVKNFRVGERPWEIADAEIIPGFSVINHLANGDAEIAIRIKIRTSGKTPAIILGYMPYQWKVGPFKKIEKEMNSFVPDYSIHVPGISDFPSEDWRIAPTTPHSNYVKADIIKKVEHGDWDAYVIGAVRYTDVFKPTQIYETLYCFHYQHIGLPIANCGFPNFGMR